MPNAQEQFLQDLKGDEMKLNDDAQFISPNQATPKAEEATPQGDEDDSPRNRRERRLAAKLQAEREANIALNERLKAISELNKVSSNPDISDPDLARLFGDTPEGKLAQELFTKKFQETEEKAYKRFLEEQEKQASILAQKEAENSREIDDGFDSIEDEFGVDLSGETKESQKLRNGFIDFLSDISPKDRNGEIIEYADFTSAFETYMKLNDKGKPKEMSQRQKSLADRSMQSGGPSSIPQSPKGPVNFAAARRYIDSLGQQLNQ